MTVTGLGVINRISEQENSIKGVLSFINEKDKRVDKIGFSMSKTQKNLEYLRKIIEHQETVELIGKLYTEEKHYYINVISLQVCRAKYKLFQEVDNYGIEI